MNNELAKENILCMTLCDYLETMPFPGITTPYIPSPESPNAEWDFGSIGSKSSLKVPKLPNIYLWDLPSFSDPSVFDLLYGHNKGLYENLSIVKRRSACLQAQAFPKCPPRKITQCNSQDLYSGIYPNFKALMNFKPMLGETTPYTSPPIRVDYGPVGKKVEVKLVSDLPDLVKDIRFVGSLPFIRNNPHFTGQEVIIGQRNDSLSHSSANKTVFQPHELPLIPALIVDPINKTLVLNKKALLAERKPSRIVLNSSKSSEVIAESETTKEIPDEDQPVPHNEPDSDYYHTVSSSEGEMDDNDEVTLQSCNDTANNAVQNENPPLKQAIDNQAAVEPDEALDDFDECLSDCLESISSAWSEKSLDYESISSGKFSVCTNSHVRSTWDSSKSSVVGHSDASESNTYEDAQTDGFSTISSNTLEGLPNDDTDDDETEDLPTP